MQRENTDKPGTSVGDLVSKPVSKLRELAEAELDYVAGGTRTYLVFFDWNRADLKISQDAYQGSAQ